MIVAMNNSTTSGKSLSTFRHYIPFQMLHKGDDSATVIDQLILVFYSEILGVVQIRTQLRYHIWESVIQGAIFFHR
jgi:hypothetical protein